MLRSDIIVRLYHSEEVEALLFLFFVLVALSNCDGPFSNSISPEERSNLVESSMGIWPIDYESFSSNMVSKSSEDFFYIDSSKLEGHLKDNNIVLDMVKLNSVKFILEELLNNSLGALKYISVGNVKDEFILYNFEGEEKKFDILFANKNILGSKKEALFFSNERNFISSGFSNSPFLNPNKVSESFMGERMVQLSLELDPVDKKLSLYSYILLPENRIHIGSFSLGEKEEFKDYEVNESSDEDEAEEPESKNEESNT